MRAACPRDSLFVDDPDGLTARMIRAAMRRGVRTVVFTEGGSRVGARCCCRPWPTLRARPSAQVAPGAASVSRSWTSPMRGGWRGPSQRRCFGSARPGDRAGDEPHGVALAWPTLVAGGPERQIVNTAICLHTAGLGPITVLVARLHRPPEIDFLLQPLLPPGVRVRLVRVSVVPVPQIADDQR